MAQTCMAQHWQSHTPQTSVLTRPKLWCLRYLFPVFTQFQLLWWMHNQASSIQLGFVWHGSRTLKSPSVYWFLLHHLCSLSLSHFLHPSLCRCNAVSGHGQMMDVETTTSYSDFINCDRTGRRNAVPDIQGQGAAASTSELTKDMEGMDLKAAGEHICYITRRCLHGLWFY